MAVARPPTSPPAYRLSAVRVMHGGRTVLDLDMLAIAAASVTAVVGPNGAGKSTLLRTLAFLQQPVHGDIELHGRRIASDRRAQLQARRAVTYVAQSPLLLRRSVRANVAYGLKQRSVASAARVDAALAQVGLVGFAERPAWKLSGGEVQRVAMARALAIAPAVYLFDEPTANADPQYAPLLESLLRRLAAAGSTVVFSTHSLDQAYRTADQLISLADGRAAPFPLVNLLRGVTQEHGGRRYFVTPHLRIELPGNTTAQLVAIDPDSLIIARGALQSSARNCVTGTIARVERDSRGVLLSIDCGQALLARVTAHSYAELDLNVGTKVNVIFKSVAVHVVDGRLDPPAPDLAVPRGPST